jgi:inosine-uridine nucleoside N-ribohydrolase
MVKILLDTDIGSDIDDAVCLAYLLAQPDCDLLGVTTVTGEGRRRAMMASALCKVAGQDAPIYVGAELPLIIEPRQPKAPQADMLARWDHDTDFPTGEAVEFMRQTIRRNPGEVVLLAIGPLTNLALLFATDPGIPALLKGLVLMDGHFLSKKPVPEWDWNTYCDPHAAAIVYRAAPPMFRAVGLDVSRQVKMLAADARTKFDKRLLLPVRDFAEVWFRGEDAITFHDPLAAATIFDAGICAFERGLVTVDLLDDGNSGITRWQANAPASRHEIATSVNPARFFDHYFSVFS